MLRKLDKTFEYSLLLFLKRNPEINLFIIGDIENFGFDKDFQDVWAEYNDEGEYVAVLLRYRTHFVFYSDSLNYDIDGFSTIIESYKECTDISGEASVIKPLLDRLKWTKTREQYFAKLNKDKFIFDDKEDKVIKAKIEDAKGIYDLRQYIEEFKDFKTSFESMRESLSGDGSRTYIIKDKERVVSSASTSAENSILAMVVSVMTHPNYRKKGLASRCVSQICHELISEDKGLCLFYDNPKAGSIYKKIGFKDIGKWITAIF